MTVRPADEDVEAVRWLPTKLREEADYWGSDPTHPALETAQPALARYLNEAADLIDSLASRLSAAMEGQAAAEQRAADAAKHAEEVTRYANRMVEKADRFELVLLAIAKNAKAWHGNGEEGPRRALAVIANWARNPTFVPPSILAAARAGEATEGRTEQWEPVSREDLREGDEVRLWVFDQRDGWHREEREVVAINPIRLRMAESDRIDGGKGPREYEWPEDDRYEPHRKPQRRVVGEATEEKEPAT